MPFSARHFCAPVRQPLHLLAAGSPFVAIDFETADHGADSACAIALTRVERQKIVRREARRIRPPRSQFIFTYIHGIRWEDVASAPTFGETWPELTVLLEGAAFIAAHNADFDRRVLEACCRAANLVKPTLPFLCTVELARRTWGLQTAGLAIVCQRLGIELTHHDPASDSEACARIVIAAVKLRMGASAN